MGVVDADLLTRRRSSAAERTYQLLAPGRWSLAGRRERLGAPCCRPARPCRHAGAEGQDRDAFVAVEMAEREVAGLPPFGDASRR